MGKKPTIKRFPGNSVLLNFVAIVVVGVLLLIFTLLFLNIYTRHGHNVIVPQLQGLQTEEAEIILKSKGLTVQVIDSIFKVGAVPGSIIDQTPKPNNRVKEGRNIYITIYSYKPQQISIPEIVDFSTRQAVSILNSIGFNQITIEEVPSQYHGLVMSVEYKGKKLLPDEQVPAGSPLKLIVGSGEVIDSLDMDKEFIISPGSSRTVRDSVRNNSSERKSDMDDSFF